MLFSILPPRSNIPSGKNHCYLLTNDWNDWFQFITQFYLIYLDSEGKSHDIGHVKIGEYNMKDSQTRPSLVNEFETLDSDYFFSLGQSIEYYESLEEIGFEIRIVILKSLNDIAYDLNQFYLARNEYVTKRSLMRNFSQEEILGQLHRLSHGGARLHEYNFEYIPPVDDLEEKSTTRLKFKVQPESKPPTNVHVLIGGNGVGKSYLLNSMVQALLLRKSKNISLGTFIWRDENKAKPFSNLILVSFSAFDDFPMFSERKTDEDGLDFAFIGLKEPRSDGKDMEGPGSSLPKTPKSLSLEFVRSLRSLRGSSKLERWLDALQLLEFDPLFNSTEIATLGTINRRIFSEAATDTFDKLSSGHKSILLSLTRLVELVEEKTLVLIDEPEAHLHPPLLSAFIRAISDLLINRNGIAIIATHSPVILQEVPKSCVWIIGRSNHTVIAERPENETFGENVSILTRDIFSLEVTHSGFHKMIRDVVNEADDYEEALELFSGELGGEAKAILRTLMIEKRKQE